MPEENNTTTVEKKTNVKNSIVRLVTFAILMILQFAWVVYELMALNNYNEMIGAVIRVITVIVVLAIYGRHQNSAFKLPWIILISAAPILGIALYLLMGRPGVVKRMADRYTDVDEKLFPRMKQDEKVFSELEKRNPGVAGQCRYLKNYGPYPVYSDTEVTYYDDALKGLEAQLQDLRQAKEYIFMEYYAIEDAESFGRVKEILAQKAAEGLDVRLFYDDVGSIHFIDEKFITRMETLGVKCRRFNPVVPILNVYVNHRDHRKFTIIDGKIGYTGGYNLANEYFNLTHPYGEWKDTGVRLEGGAVRNLIVMFLEMWYAGRVVNKVTEEKDKELLREDMEKYLPFDTTAEVRSASAMDLLRSRSAGTGEYMIGTGSYVEAGRPMQKGYVQPYADSPLDNEHVGETVYMNILKNAKNYCYFTTPYLVITDEFSKELTQAAKRGVDVRIITPGIPDKKVVYTITRSYYTRLARAGVRIYEYTPGFIHAKMCVSDDQCAVVGTINMDYRSLYLHFEDGCYFYDCKAVYDVKKDVDQSLERCKEVTEAYAAPQGMFIRMVRCILRLVAPLV